MAIDVTAQVDTGQLLVGNTTVDRNDIAIPMADVVEIINNVLNGAQSAESLRFDELGAAPSTPASGKWKAYFKSTGLFVVDDAGVEYGPLLVPNNATYITQTPNSLLSAEQALSTLATGMMKVTTTTGVISSLKENSAGAGQPNANDDTADGYSIGSLWYDTGYNTLWLAHSVASNQAKWMRIGSVRARNGFSVRGSNTSALGVGVANPTTANSPANVNSVGGTYISLPTTSSSGNIGGFVSTSFNLLRLGGEVIFECFVKTPATITTLRYWIGLTSEDVTNVDSLVATATEFVGFRFSTVAPDTGWVPITCDGTTQNAAAAIGTVAANTAYYLKIRLPSANNTAFFSVNGGAETEVQVNLPIATTDLGFCVRCITTSAAIRELYFNRLVVDYDN